MNETLLKFIQSCSPDGGFLQSVFWRKFQQSVGRKTHNISESDDNGEIFAHANIIAHALPVVGRYFYIPRGPVTHNAERITHNDFLKKFIDGLIDIAKKENINWIRIEPNGREDLKLIQENLPQGIRIKKSAVDVQPKEILVLDITKSEEEILAGMKQKTRYNVRLAEKRSVHVTCNTKHVTREYIEEFLKLVKITAERDRITSHPEKYYRKMFEIIPSDILKLYVAEYEGKIIAANLVLFFGCVATYMHGASDNEHRNVMAPYLLQWQQIRDAKKMGCEKYDFGGVKTGSTDNSWPGITKFKTGFAPEMKPVEFPGSYDIVLNPGKYNLYRVLQKMKKLFNN